MGGMAFKDKVRRIQRDEIQPTIRWLCQKTGLPYPYMINSMLGSAGKAESSGDVDINMDHTKYDKRLILQTLVTALGPDNVKDWTHVNQIFTCVPIAGNANVGQVQIDFLFGDKVWQTFSYHSPGKASIYKGLFRTELIKAAVAFNSDWTLDENGKLVARVGPTFFHDRGLVWRYRHKAPRKDGKGRVQAFSELSEQDFMQLYPQANKASQSVIITPEGVSELLFNNQRELGTFDRYETLHERLREFYGRKSYGTIMTIFEERLNNLKVDIPKDIADEILTAAGASS